MSAKKPPAKAAKKPKETIKDLNTKKDPKGGPTAKSKRVIDLQSS